mmetsp:Transcript_21272/g.72049  ORF Transcript_21272/g.72049 Transcript_21272/m.72049 type:complete len:255 (-) Transcript_21272:890-1654(-)
MKVVVALDQPRQRGLDVCDLRRRELVLVQRHLGVAQEAQEAQLLWDEEKQSLARGGAAARRAAHAVDVLARVVGRVVLDDPVDVRDVEAARGDVGAEEDAGLCLAELEERGSAFGLLLSAVDVHDRHINVVQQVGVELYGVARGEEDHDLVLLMVPFQERKEEAEAVPRRDDHVALLQRVHRRGRLAVVDADVDGFRPDGEARQVFHLARLRRREQRSLSGSGQQAHDAAHVVLEALLQDAVRLVDDEEEQVAN